MDLLSLPPQREWICSECLKEGVDFMQADYRNDYEFLKRKKDLLNLPTTGRKG